MFIDVNFSTYAISLDSIPHMDNPFKVSTCTCMLNDPMYCVQSLTQNICIAYTYFLYMYSRFGKITPNMNFSLLVSY